MLSHDKPQGGEVTLEEASKQNPSMLLASKSNPEREQVLETIENGQIAECIKIFFEG